MLPERGVPPLGADDASNEGVLGWLHSVARSHVDVALRHPIKLIANALGSPPPALAGKAEHARRHVHNGVDIVIAQGYEAGGRTGKIASMVLLPEIVDAVGERVAVLGAGGIGSGRQIAAALALGASGVWMGSYWLTTDEYQLGADGAGGPSTMQRALMAAHSDDPAVDSMFIGQIVGRLNRIQPVAEVMAELLTVSALIAFAPTASAGSAHKVNW